MVRKTVVTRWLGGIGGVLLFLPFLYLFVASLDDGGRAWGAAFAAASGRESWTLLGRSLILACGSGLIACLLGAGAALVFERRRFPLAGFWRAAALAALVCPPVFQVAVWERLAVPGGLLTFLFPMATDGVSPFPIRNLGFACWLLGLTYSPLFFFLVGTGLRALPPGVVEAARLSRGPVAVYGRVVLPLVAPWFVAAAGVCFPLLFLNYEVPRLLDLYTYPVLIHVEYAARNDPGAAFAVAAPGLVLTLLVVLPCMRWAQRRGFALSGREPGLSPSRPETPPPGAGAWLLFLGWWSLVAVLPVGILAWIAGGLDAFHRAWLTDWERVGWSAVVAGVTACAAVTLSALLVLSRRGTSGHVGVSFWVLLALPGSLLGFALISLCQREPLFSLYDSWGILVVAGVFRFFPLAYYALAAHLRTVPASLWEAAQLGPSRLARWGAVGLPLMAPGLMAGAVAVTLFASQELSATVLLAPPGREPLIVRIYNLLHYDPERDVLAALALLQIGVILALTAGWVWLGRRIERGLSKR